MIIMTFHSRAQTRQVADSVAWLSETGVSEWLPWNLNIKSVSWIFKSKGFPIMINHTCFFVLPSLIPCNILSGQKLLRSPDGSRLCISCCLACLLHPCLALPASLNRLWVLVSSQCSGSLWACYFCYRPPGSAAGPWAGSRCFALHPAYFQLARKEKISLLEQWCMLFNRSYGPRISFFFSFFLFFLLIPKRICLCQ